MKRYTICCLVIFSMFFGSVTAEMCAQSGMMLSEIQFMPAATNGPVKIELFNKGTNSVDVSGWLLMDKDQNQYVFPAMPQVPSGGFIVVSFGCREPTGKDTVFFKDKIACLNCNEEWATEAFRGLENECALFSSQDWDRPGVIVDFVRWGRRIRGECVVEPTVMHRRAAEQGIWSLKTDGIYVGRELKYGPRPPMLPGGSLARRGLTHRKNASKYWAVYDPPAVTLGTTNFWPTPGKYIPREGSLREASSLKFIVGVQNLSADDLVQIQVSQDAGFSDILIEVAQKKCLWSPNMKLDPGTYYWRVRVKSSDLIGKWTDATRFDVYEDTEKESVE